jgi:hypothetical protein
MTDEVTGHDEQGMEIRGPRQVSVGDQGRSLEGQGEQPINETTRLVGSELAGVVELYGGPLDGVKVQPLRTPTRDLEQLAIVDANGLPSDELYLAREVQGRWYGVHADMLQALVRSDEVHIKEPDPKQIRARLQEMFGADAKIVLPICVPGTHRWTAWQATPRCNRTRICVVCQTSQGAVL